MFLLSFLIMLALPRGAGRRPADEFAPGEAAPALDAQAVTR